MKAAKFLHLADAYLGGVIWGNTRTQRMRVREAMRVAFERAVDCALREAIDAVLVAGTLYEREYLSLELAQFLTAQFQRLHEAAIPIVTLTGAAAGQEDALGGSPAWPDSLHRVEGGSPTLIDLREAPISAPLRVFRGSRVADFSSVQDAPDDDVPTVGMIHAPQWTHPADLAALPQSGCAYWALGGAHRQQRLLEEPTTAWQAGSLMGRRPSEAGQKGGLLVTLVPGASPNVSAKTFAPLSWRTMHLRNLEDVHSRDDLRRHTLKQLPIRRSTLMLNIILEGPSPLARALADPNQRRAWAGPLAGRLGVVAVHLDASALAYPRDPTAHRGRADVLAETLPLIDEDHSYTLRPELLAGLPEELDRREYVHSLLRGLDREAVERLTIG